MRVLNSDSLFEITSAYLSAGSSDSMKPIWVQPLIHWEIKHACLAVALKCCSASQSTQVLWTLISGLCYLIFIISEAIIFFFFFVDSFWVSQCPVISLVLPEYWAQQHSKYWKIKKYSTAMHSHNAFTLLPSYPIKVSCNQWEWFESTLCMYWWCVTYKIDGVKGSCDLAQSDFFEGLNGWT